MTLLIKNEKEENVDEMHVNNIGKYDLGSLIIELMNKNENCKIVIFNINQINQQVN